MPKNLTVSYFGNFYQKCSLCFFLILLAQNCSFFNDEICWKSLIFKKFPVQLVIEVKWANNLWLGNFFEFLKSKSAILPTWRRVGDWEPHSITRTSGNYGRFYDWTIVYKHRNLIVTTDKSDWIRPWAVAVERKGTFLIRMAEILQEN